MSQAVFYSNSDQDTMELGRRLGGMLPSGAFIALQGELGGGKTCFTRGVVQSVSPDSSRLVASPTFAIMNEYPGAVPVYHFDFYRLNSEYEIIELGFEDYFAGNGICIAEWSERLGSLLPAEHIRITFEHAGEERRRITMAAGGERHSALLKRFAAACSGKIL